MIRRAAIWCVLLAAPLALAGCAPMPLADAERVCLEDARAATGPQGKVGIGVASGRGGVRPFSRVEVSVSSDYIMGRDPAQAYDACVQRRAGQPPSRPLHDITGWSAR
ncbi:hypothetical protein [Paracoccus jeotgali]|uniref:hypothetical protein n=1 Tax=Paracoccus jeotgali TaxID=2065379 RepID=UPI0028B25093|nr:hypothetical protein [Paracoccus jeotgali]